jgi:SET domain-containing protein
MNYRPLPSNLTIKSSSIDGLGLFATKKIKAATDLGHAHFKFFGQDLVRTPLVGFVNHSEDPNCILAWGTEMGYSYSKLITIRDIHKDEEITLKYSLYNPTQEEDKTTSKR